jgi:hypothetical protein
MRRRQCASVETGPRACGGDYRLECRVLEWLSHAFRVVITRAVVGFVDLSDTVEDDDE